MKQRVLTIRTGSIWIFSDRQAAVGITEEKHIVKLSLSPEGELRIQPQAYEPDRVYFRDSLKIYIEERGNDNDHGLFA